MRKNDILWGAILACAPALLAIPSTREMFIGYTSLHPYIGGFVKFAILATVGELLAVRITTGEWTVPKGVGYRMAIWGFLGMAITLIFSIFAAGVGGAIEKGLLPGAGLPIAFAFLTSAIMNLTFAPVMMIFHRITDTYIDMRYKGAGKSLKIGDVIKEVDWSVFYSFVICKTVPFFWIPAHTVTFMLPSEYRVLMAAALSIALGLILALAKKKGSRTCAVPALIKPEIE